MSTDRFQQRANDLRRAVARLVEACEQQFSPFVRDSALLRFKFCWELAWRTLQLRLEMAGTVASTPQDVFRAALERGLINDETLWSDAQQMRLLARHAHDDVTADTIYQFLRQSGQQIFQPLAVAVAQWQTSPDTAPPLPNSA